MHNTMHYTLVALAAWHVGLAAGSCENKGESEVKACTADPACMAALRDVLSADDGGAMSDAANDGACCENDLCAAYCTGTCT
jgi:hypothetical protein